MRERPLSPHLQVWRFTTSMAMSIATPDHRRHPVGRAAAARLVADGRGHGPGRLRRRHPAAVAWPVQAAARRLAAVVRLSPLQRHPAPDLGPRASGMERHETPAQRRRDPGRDAWSSPPRSATSPSSPGAPHEPAHAARPGARPWFGEGGRAHWWAQRLSSVALVPLTLWFLFALLGLPAFDYLTRALVDAARRGRRCSSCCWSARSATTRGSACRS